MLGVLLFSCGQSNQSTSKQQEYQKIHSEYKTCTVVDIQSSSYTTNESLKKGAIGAGAGLASHVLLGTGLTKSVLIGAGIGAASGGGTITEHSSYKVILQDSAANIYTHTTEYNPGIKLQDTVKYYPYKGSIVKYYKK